MPTRLRHGVGLRPLHTVPGREDPAPAIVSPLRKPRNQACPDWERKPALKGFATRAGIGGPVALGRQRAHVPAPAERVSIAECASADNAGYSDELLPVIYNWHGAR